MPRTSSWNKKRKFAGNQHHTVSVANSREAKSASLMKLMDSSIRVPNLDNSELSGYRLIDLTLLQELISSISVCNICKTGNLKVEEHSIRGLASTLQLICEDCNESKQRSTSRMVQNNIFDVNLRFVYGLRTVGKSRKAGVILCALMDLPAPPTKFTKYNNRILKAAQEVSESSTKAAAEEVKHLETDGTVDTNEPVETTVTVDGTWMKRGYTSLHGVVTAISVQTGKLLDAEIESKYCSLCANHVDKKCNSVECQRTHSDSSGAMEVSAAKTIFSRSIAKHNLMYTRYVGDGDSKAFEAVKASKPYPKTIEKHECIAHVSKRMGTRLRKLKKDNQKTKLRDGKGLGGKHRLTDSVIDSLQHYYGTAIRENSKDLKAMKNAVWATYFHKLSTDDNPQHGLCPAGPTSWCGYNRGKASIPPTIYKHTKNLPEAILEKIKPVYRALADEELLKRCLHGKTQNCNESFNQLIWLRCPKTSFSCSTVVKIAVYDAIVYFNSGNEGRKMILEGLGVRPQSNCISALSKLDAERIAKAEKMLSCPKKNKRTKLNHDKDMAYIPGGCN